MWRRVRTWFADLRIIIKINVLLLFLMLTFVAAAVAGAPSFDDPAAGRAAAQHRTLAAALDHVQAAQTAESRQRRAVQAFLLAGDPDLSTFRSTDAAFAAAASGLGAMALPPPVRDGLRTYTTAVAEWRTIRDGALRVARRGDDARARRIVVDRGLPVDERVQDGGRWLLARLVGDLSRGAEPVRVMPRAHLGSMVWSILAGILVAVAFSTLTARTISRPLNEVVDVLERVARGDLSRRVELNRKDEIGRMGRALNETLGVLREAVDDAHHRATHDPLTGLANRRLLAERMSHAQDTRRTGDTVAVLLLDLDGFKQVNDTYGHAAGDQLLVTVAERLRAGVRPSDTVARIGGDEFLVLLNGVAAAEADRIAQHLLTTVQAPVELDVATVSPGASIGLSVWDGTCSLDDLLQESDDAMYAAKSGGKGRVVRLAA